MKRWHLVVLMMFILYGLNTMDKSGLGILGKTIMNDIHADPLQWGIVGSAFFSVYWIANIFGGVLGDKLGPRVMLLSMAIIWSLVQFGTAFATSVGVLIVARIALGIAEGPCFAMLIANTNDWVEPKSRTKAIAFFQAGGKVGSYVCAPLIVWYSSLYGWRACMAAMGVLTLAWFVVYMFVDRGKKDQHLKQVAEIEKTVAEEGQLQAIRKILPIIATPTFIMAVLGFFATNYSLTWTQSWAPIYLQSPAVGASAKTMSVAIMVMGLIAIPINLFFSAIVDHMYKIHKTFEKVHIPVAGLGLLSNAVFLVLMTFTTNIILICIYLAIIQAFNALYWNLSGQIAGALAPKARGLMIGVLCGLGNLGGLFSPTITGFLLKFHGGANDITGYNYSIYVSAVLFAVISVLFLIFVKPQKVIEKSGSDIIA